MTPSLRRPSPLAVLGAAALLATGILASPTTSAAAAAAPSGVTDASGTSSIGAGASAASPCRLISAGKVAGLRGRPAHVTFALASGYGTSKARVTRCTKRANGTYAQSWSVAGHVGRAGFARPGAKREGDGRTPSGVYRLGTAFGAKDPGSRVGYLRLKPRSCWGSTVGARTYNRYFVGRCGAADESMYRDVRGAYAQGMVIEYNTAPIRQGRGSAIFLHVGTGGSTAGCVSIPERLVRQTITSTRPGDLVVMGVGRAVLRA